MNGKKKEVILMRKLLLVLMVAAFVALPMAAQAATFSLYNNYVTFSDTELETFTETEQGTLTGSGLHIPPFGTGPGVDFDIDYTGPTNYTASGFNDIQIGHDWPTANFDFTGYDGYALSFTNHDDENHMILLTMNTGWTDAPWSEGDNQYDTGWVWLTAGQTTVLTMDFAGVGNLDHVTNIGFKVGSNGPNTPSTPAAYTSTGGTIHAQAVPIPSALILLGSGLLGLIGIRRKMAA